MASELYNVIDALSREKGIDPQIVVSAVEDAIVVATRKYYKTQENLRAELDKESGQIRAYAVRTIVENSDLIEDPLSQITLDEAKRIDPAAEIGGELRTYKATDVLGRIAAQLAKQVIFQKVREAERDTVYNEYIGRVGEIINATIKRNEGQDVIVDLGKAEGRMPKKEQSRLESFAPGERVRCVISRVEKASKGPQVVVSRAAPELVTHLFQTEVPEIYDNTVVIRAIAREAGERTKIAVMSKDKDVDPVGACVGMKGMRVQSIIRELRGEKIDIIEYHEDPVTFAEKALQPAKVSRVTVLEGQEKHLEVIVDDSQLSLAIGKKGQNVRLAAKLLGWKIDIKSEEEKRQEVEEQMRGVLNQQSTPLETVPDLEPGIIEKLVAAGITTVESVADMTPEQLEEVPGIGPKTVEKISIAVNNYFASLDAAADGLPDAGEAVGEDVSAEEEARELEATEGGESVESEEAAGEAPEEVAAAERDDAETDVEQLAGDTDVEPGDEGGQAGDEEGLSDEPESSSESVEELADEGQAFEAEVIDGVENAPLADEGERIIRERIETPNENVSDEEEPGEQR
ncbi:MAG TPA: transcription termination factor NusA [Verrucomicrobiae bacterium]|jgi:N utilization substance protein A|nr:transcription termination factor NusA [Verrucomicrobiae bacterium]